MIHEVLARSVDHCTLHPSGRGEASDVDCDEERSGRKGRMPKVSLCEPESAHHHMREYHQQNLGHPLAL